jgi:hypothetical protein
MSEEVHSIYIRKHNGTPHTKVNTRLPDPKKKITLKLLNICKK